MAVDTSAQRLYIAALGNNSVEVIDLKSAMRISTLRGPQEPQGIAVVPASGSIVVASGKDGICRFYDKSLKLTGELRGLDDADNVRFDPRSHLIYVGYGDGALAIIDPEKPALLATIRLDGHPESFQLEPKSDRIFVNVPTAHQIAVIDREHRSVIGRWPVKDASANFPMAVHPDHARIFTACRSPARLLVLDSATGKVVSTIPCVADADDVFFDAALHRIYIAGGEGAISVVQEDGADHYSLLEPVKTAPGARTALFVPDWHRLYLAIPHRGSQSAEIRVFATEATEHRPE